VSIKEQALKAAVAINIDDDELSPKNIERLRNRAGHWDDIDSKTAAEILELIRLCKEASE